MALANAALTDIRNYIKKRCGYVRYRVGSSYYQVPIIDVQVLGDGTVRVKVSIVPGSAVTINRVELYNNNGDLWAYQDISITISSVQTGVLYWFDFTIKEGE